MEEAGPFLAWVSASSADMGFPASTTNSAASLLLTQESNSHKGCPTAEPVIPSRVSPIGSLRCPRHQTPTPEVCHTYHARCPHPSAITALLPRDRAQAPHQPRGCRPPTGTNPPAGFWLTLTRGTREAAGSTSQWGWRGSPENTGPSHGVTPKDAIGAVTKGHCWKLR